MAEFVKTHRSGLALHYKGHKYFKIREGSWVDFAGVDLAGVDLALSWFGGVDLVGVDLWELILWELISRHQIEKGEDMMTHQHNWFTSYLIAWEILLIMFFKFFWGIWVWRRYHTYSDVMWQSCDLAAPTNFLIVTVTLWLCMQVIWLVGWGRRSLGSVWSDGRHCQTTWRWWAIIGTLSYTLLCMVGNNRNIIIYTIMCGGQ